MKRNTTFFAIHLLIALLFSNCARDKLCSVVKADFEKRHPTYEFVHCAHGDGDLVTVNVDVQFRRLQGAPIERETLEYWETEGGWLIREEFVRQNIPHFFSDFVDKKSVTIGMGNFGLENVPKEISMFKKAEYLALVPDSAGWTTYPPLSVMEELVKQPPFKELPEELAGLTNLKHLVVTGLDINKLPANFTKLENLETLDISMNKLTISDELPKLIALKKLKHLRWSGNLVDSLDVKNLKKERPDIELENDF